MTLFHANQPEAVQVTAGALALVIRVLAQPLIQTVPSPQAHWAEHQ